MTRSPLTRNIVIRGLKRGETARAYWEKSEENLRRWREAREAQA